MADIVQLRKSNPTKDLADFFRTMFGSQRGFIYSPLKEWNEERTWKPRFFRWPEQEEDLINHVIDNTPTHDVYYCPALTKKPEVPTYEKTENFAGSYWVWCEFDYGTPSAQVREGLGVPEPSVRVRSSDAGHEHWYWKIDHWQIDPSALKNITQRLAYALDADFCFDWTRVLRVPYTIHHESKLQVTLLHKNGRDLNNYAVFENVPEVEISEVTGLNLGEIPQVNRVLMKYAIPDKFIDLFLKSKDDLAPKNGKPGKRSDALMRMGYECCEIGMSNEETFAVLLNLDCRWEKYAPKGYRNSTKAADDRQLRALLKIINRARVKHPLTLPDDFTIDYPVFGVLELLASDIQVEWVIPELIHKEGLWLITGLSEAGKSQLAIWMLMHIAIGKSFLGRWSAGEPQKVMFVSMEMSFAEIKKLVSDMAPNFTEEELELMTENLKIIPLGESIPLDKVRYQEVVNKIVDIHKPIGIVFDSLGIAINDDIRDPTVINNTFNYIKKDLNRARNCFVGFIHHHKKPENGKAKITNKEEVYGSVFIVNHVRTIIGLHATGTSVYDPIEVTCVKLSLHPRWSPFRVRRTQPALGFEVINIKGFSTSVTDDDVNDLTGFDGKDDDGDDSRRFDLG